MKSLSQFGHQKPTKTRRKGKNMTVDRKEDALKINYSTSPAYQKPSEIKISDKIIVDRDHYNTNYDDLGKATPILLTDSETGYQIKQYALTTNNSSKHFNFDTARYSADVNGPVLTHPEQRRMTQKPCTQLDTYMNDFGFERKHLTRNRDTETYSKTFESLQNLKRATGGDTGSSNFREEIKIINDSDSETELVFIDLHSQKIDEPSLSKPNTELYQIFEVVNKPGVSSTEILNFLKIKAPKKSELNKLLKLQDLDNDHYTLLHYTAKLGFVSIMTYLMTHCQSIDLNKFTKQGKTALHI